MTEVSIEGKIQLDPEQIEDAIINKAARQIVDGMQMRAVTDETIRDLITKRIEAVVTERVEELLSKPIVQRDTFGDPVGKAKTLPQIVADQAETFLTERVDSHGKPTRQGYGTNMARLEYLIRDGLGGEATAACRKVAKEYKAELEKSVRQSIAKIVTEQVKVR